MQSGRLCANLNDWHELKCHSALKTGWEFQTMVLQGWLFPCNVHMYISQVSLCECNASHLPSIKGLSYVHGHHSPIPFSQVVIPIWTTEDSIYLLTPAWVPEFWRENPPISFDLSDHEWCGCEHLHTHTPHRGDNFSKFGVSLLPILVSVKLFWNWLMLPGAQRHQSFIKVSICLTYPNNVLTQ